MLPQAPDELPRIATMPSFGPEARAAAAAALAVVLTVIDAKEIDFCFSLFMCVLV